MISCRFLDFVQFLAVPTIFCFRGTSGVELLYFSFVVPAVVQSSVAIVSHGFTCFPHGAVSVSCRAFSSFLVFQNSADFLDFRCPEFLWSAGFWILQFRCVPTDFLSPRFQRSSQASLFSFSMHGPILRSCCCFCSSICLLQFLIVFHMAGCCLFPGFRWFPRFP